MQIAYSVSGLLPMDFVGQIAYTVCLNKPCKAMDVQLTFDKQHVSDVTPKLRDRLFSLCAQKYGKNSFTPEEEAEAYQNMKTEIQLLVMMNDQFVGGIHKQLTDRHLYISAEEATEGGIPQPSIEGVIKVIVLVFNVLYDDTKYSVTLRTEEE